MKEQENQSVHPIPDVLARAVQQGDEVRCYPAGVTVITIRVTWGSGYETRRYAVRSGDGAREVEWSSKQGPVGEYLGLWIPAQPGIRGPVCEVLDVLNMDVYRDNGVTPESVPYLDRIDCVRNLVALTSFAPPLQLRSIRTNGLGEWATWNNGRPVAAILRKARQPGDRIPLIGG